MKAGWRVYFLACAVAVAVAVLNVREPIAYATYLCNEEEWGFHGPIVGWGDFWWLTATNVFPPLLLGVALLAVGTHKRRAAPADGEKTRLTESSSGTTRILSCIVLVAGAWFLCDFAGSEVAKSSNWFRSWDTFVKNSAALAIIVGTLLGAIQGLAHLARGIRGEQQRNPRT